MMNKILCSAAMSIAAAGLGLMIGPAGQAVADPELNGTYTFTEDETQATTTGFPLSDPKVRTDQWVITSCGAGCANVTITGAPAIANSGELRLNNGRWEMTQEFSLMHCGAGPDITTFTSIDAATMQGMQDSTNHCVGDNKITTPVTLTPA